MSARTEGAAVTALVLLAAQPAAAQERTGPRAQPTTPSYAQPAPALAPAPPSGPITAAPTGGAPVTDLRIAVSGSYRAAVPPPGWRPPAETGDLRLDHRPGEAFDEAWVRRQFAQNGVPGAGVPRALAVVQLVNRAYLTAGYINSGVVVRPSSGPGALDLEIIYGALASPGGGVPPVTVEWLGGRDKGLDARYVTDRMPSAQRRPLNAQELERDFRLLAEDPAVRTINADLRPGARPGEATLGLAIYPQDRFDLWVSYANNRSPSVGGERTAAGVLVRNVIGAGDRLNVEAGLTDGVEDLTVAYAFPFLSPRTTLSLRGAINEAAVIDPLLAPLDIKAKDKAFEAAITRKLLDVPLLPGAEAGRWRPARTLTAGVSFAWRQSTAYLFGERFSFAPGAVDGQTEYRAIRLTGDYVVRNVDQVFAVSVTGTRGLDGTKTDAFPLTDPIPENDFHAVLAQVNYARRLSGDGLEVRARVYGQWADGVLYSGERFSAGGETTVRGYRENLLLADKGLVGSVELAQPLRLAGRQGAGRTFDWGAFIVSAFGDAAYMSNAKGQQPIHRIYSVGGSLTWAPSEAMSARITYAKALNEVEVAGERDLQDRGVSFRVTVRPLLLP